MDAHGAVAAHGSPGTVLIAVGSLADQTSSSSDECTVHSLTGEGASTASLDGAGAECTLRSAILLANKQANSTAVRIAVRSGRILLAATLPVLTSAAVQIVGSASRSAPQPETGSDADATLGVAVSADVYNDADPYFPHGKTSGQSGPIGTVIDGRGRVQLLRTAVGSSVHLQTVRLENGAALGSDSNAAVESGAGGAIHSRGILVLTNVAVRNCHGIPQQRKGSNSKRACPPKFRSLRVCAQRVRLLSLAVGSTSRRRHLHRGPRGGGPFLHIHTLSRGVLRRLCLCRKLGPRTF